MMKCKTILLSVVFFSAYFSTIFGYSFNLSLCAIFQDEAPYLKEWIEFHRIVGVEHFYLYNNNSEDNFQEVLLPYVQEGIVDLIDWPYAPSSVRNWNAIQIAAYMDCIKKVKHETDWLAVIDIDEFLFPVETYSLKDFLKDYKGYAAVTANWVMYGTSNVQRILPGELLVEKLIFKENSAGNPHVKSIVKPRYVAGASNPHHFQLKEGYSQVNEDKISFEGPLSPYVTINKIRINHYWTREEHYLRNFKIPRRQAWGDNISEALIAQLSGAEDKAIFKYLPKLHSRMRK